MHLIIVEDLDIDRKNLMELIRRDCTIHNQEVDFSLYDSGEAFMGEYRVGACDGLFLDILMEGITGIETARKIREAEPHLPIIFTTNEPGFALEGFSIHAMDYLVKPLSADKVSWCLNEIRGCLSAPACISLLEISGWGHSESVDIALDDILYGQYQNHIMDVHTVSGVCCARLSFQDFTALLPYSGHFYVCGRGLVVNMSYIEQVGNDTLLLKNGECLAFSRRRKTEIQKAFARWAFARSRKGGPEWK